MICMIKVIAVIIQEKQSFNPKNHDSDKLANSIMSGKPLSRLLRIQLCLESLFLACRTYNCTQKVTF